MKSIKSKIQISMLSVVLVGSVLIGGVENGELLDSASRGCRL